MGIENLEFNNLVTGEKGNFSLPFDPTEFPRETSRHYISASNQDLRDMLSTVGLTDLNQVFEHISPDLLFPQPLNLPKEQKYFEAANSLYAISALSNQKVSFRR